MRFLGNSAKWGGGGVAFLDHGTRGSAPGRRYLITKGQFDDVAAQESRRDTVDLPNPHARARIVTPVGDGFYDGILALDPDDGVPVVTFTSPSAEVDLPVQPALGRYLGAIVRGLCEVHEDTEAVIGLCIDLQVSPRAGRSRKSLSKQRNRPIDSCPEPPHCLTSVLPCVAHPR